MKETIKYLLIIFTTFTSPFSLFAQNEKIDSLHYQITENSPDSFKVSIYRQIGKAYRNISPDTSLYYLELGLNLARKKNLQEAAAYIMCDIGYMYSSVKGAYADGKKWFDQSLEIGEKLNDAKILDKANYGLGYIHNDMRQYEEAIKYYQKSHAWALKANQTNGGALSLNAIGVIHFNLMQFDKAIKYFEEARLRHHKSNEKIDEGYALVNIGAAYLMQEGKIEQALDNIHATMKLISIEEKPSLISLCYVNLADAYYKLKDHKKALWAVGESIAIYEKYQHGDYFDSMLYQRCLSLKGLKNYKVGIRTAKQGLKFVEEKGVRGGKLRFYEILSQLYEADENFKEALITERKYTTLNDSLNQLEIEQNIEQLDIRFQTKRKEAENALLKEEKKNQALVIQRRNNAILGILVVLFLASIILYQMYLARNKSKNLNEQLEKKIKQRTIKLELLNKELLQSNKELERFNYIASHDLKEPVRIIGNFTGLIKRCIANKEYKDLETYINFVEKSTIQLNRLIETTLEFSSLNTAKSTKTSLIDLEKTAEDIGASLKQELDQPHAQIKTKNLPVITFYPSVINVVLKNLIKNGIQYNRSTPPIITVFAEHTAQSFKLFVTDNGIGINPNYHEKIFDMFVRLNNREDFDSTGMGLAFCKKILKNNGGSITVKGKEGAGSTFIVELPARVLQTESENRVGAAVASLN